MAVEFDESKTNEGLEKRIIIDKRDPLFITFLIKKGIAKTPVQANWILLTSALVLFALSFYIFGIAGQQFSESEVPGGVEVNPGEVTSSS